MDIYLSVNNRADILQIPVIPASFTISKPQSTSVFETVSKGELQLIGLPKLKGITITSFFPVEGHDYSYVKNTSMWGWEYVYKIDTWIGAKLPIRLVITDTPINMVVAVKDFQYTVKTDGDLWYSLQLEEFSLLGFENTEEDKEEEIDMEELNRLKEQVEYLSGVVQELANPFIYNYIDENMPSWAWESVQKLIDKGALNGDGGGWNLTYDQLRIIVWLDRLGLLG